MKTAFFLFLMLLSLSLFGNDNHLLSGKTWINSNPESGHSVELSFFSDNSPDGKDTLVVHIRQADRVLGRQVASYVLSGGRMVVYGASVWEADETHSPRTELMEDTYEVRFGKTEKGIPVLSMWSISAPKEIHLFKLK